MRRCAAALLLGVLGCSRPTPSPPAPSPAEDESALHQTPGFVRELRRIDVALGDGATASLDALLTRPEGGPPAPLVVINHGSPRDADDRAEMAPTIFSAQSMVFARRGYAVAVVMRRGFGATGGDFAEAPGPCSNRGYLHASRTAARDVLGAVAALKREPWVDPTRIVLVGHSAGGMTSVACASPPPEGVVAVVSFAGGRGSDAPDHVCQPERLVDAYRTLGSGATIPSLWVYAENDHFFAPPLVREMFDAYRAGGDPAELLFAPPFGSDGHTLFTAAPPELWWPAVASFLAKNHLPVELVHPRAPVGLAPPKAMGATGKEAFAAYLANEGVEKAFAVGPGAWGWSSGRRTRRDAAQKALSNCAAHAPAACTLYAVDDARAP